MHDQDLIYDIAFSTYRNITVGTARRFADLGVTPAEFFTLEARRLAAITGLRENYFDDAKRTEALRQARHEALFIERGNIEILSLQRGNFPFNLSQCDDAPAMIFALGKSDLSNKRVVAIVGTRHCTQYGAEFTQHLVAELAEKVEDMAIVSGLAYGVDICAHRAAMQAGIPTGAVLAHGLNTIYPAEHRNDAMRIVSDGGFLFTEYGSTSAIHRGNFLARNRIVAGLADVTVVVESDIRGGAMTTARIAGAYNREVMATPGRTCDKYSRGCNDLIARGEASIVRDADDLISLMGWPSRQPEGTQQELPLLTDEQKDIIDYITDHPQSTVNELCLHTGRPVQYLSAVLFDMEMNDLVAALPGGRYSPIIKAR